MFAAMTHRLLAIALTLALGPLAGCDGDPAPDGGVPPTDAGEVDGGGGETDAGTDAGPMGSCAGGRPDISSIAGTEGVVISRDGTIYYSQSGAVGRLVPGGTPENAFVSLAGAGTVWGLALDAANETLFVGAPGTGVFSIDLTAGTPSAVIAAAGGAPNGLTMGADGALYYSDFSAGRVFRLMPGGSPTEVTASPIGSANGVMFLPDGRLLVASYSSGDLFALTLTAGAETARATFASGLGNPDGLALDADGNVYASDNGTGQVFQLAPDGTGATAILTGVGAAASLEFGAGVLSCSDLYVASSGVLARYEMGTTVGAAVPWH